jgi:hypothetical protein
MIRVNNNNIDVDENFFIFTDNLILNENFLNSNSFSDDITLSEKVSLKKDKILHRFISFNIISSNNKLRKLNVNIE